MVSMEQSPFVVVNTDKFPWPCHFLAEVGLTARERHITVRSVARGMSKRGRPRGSRRGSRTGSRATRIIVRQSAETGNVYKFLVFLLNFVFFLTMK